MKEVAVYQCEHCDYTHKNKSQMTKHENKCEKNPTVIEAGRVYTADEIAIEKIRQEAETIDDVIQGVIKFLATKDVDIVFNKYPSKFTKKIYGSHNRPMGKPSGRDEKGNYPYYVGWNGRWEGVLKSKRSFGFSDMCGVFADSKVGFNIPFFQTESGSFGKDFSGGGILFVEDFPKIYAKFETEIITDEINKNFVASVLDLRRVYDTAMGMNTERDEYMRRAKHIKENLRKAMESLDGGIARHTANLELQYKQTNFLELPEVTSPYLDISVYTNIRNEFRNINRASVTNTPQVILDNIQRIETIIEGFKKLVDERPALFL